MSYAGSGSLLPALSKNWWVLALRGPVAVLFGLAAIFLPLDTLEAVGLLFGAYAIVEGVLVVVSGVRRTRYRGMLIAEGASGIVAGLLALAWPDIVALVLLYVVVIWAVLTGVLEILAAITLRREIEDEWALFLVGVLSIVLGAAMAVLPGVGLPALIWLVGLYALAAGVALIVLALRVRGRRQATGSRVT